MHLFLFKERLARVFLEQTVHTLMALPKHCKFEAKKFQGKSVPSALTAAGKKVLGGLISYTQKLHMNLLDS